MRALKALVAVLALLVAFPAAAKVRVTFYAHPANAQGDRFYQHAFIRVTGQPAGASAPIDENFGFTTNQKALVFLRAHGFVASGTPEYVQRSHPYFWLELSDDQYRALREWIDTWNRPPNSYYNLYHHNCIIFIADLAKTLGLAVGNTDTLDPDAFMAEMKQLNATRVAEGLAPPMDSPAPPVLASAH